MDSLARFAAVTVAGLSGKKITPLFLLAWHQLVLAQNVLTTPDTQFYVYYGTL